MKTSEISQHFTPLDRSILVGDDAYDDYFKYLSFALDTLLNSIDNYKSDQPYEIDIIKGFSQKFLNTIEAFRLKYAFNETHPMLIDLTDSGFPNYLEFKRLEDDLNQREKHIRNGQSVETLKTLVLDELIKNKQHPTNLLQQLSRKSYYQTIERENLFTEYTPGEIVLIKEDQSVGRRLLYSWGSFDSVTNRPFIYMLVFDNHRPGSNGTDLSDIGYKESLRKLTHNTAPLKVMISDIDELHAQIHPKVLKRIDLGPIYGKYSKDEHEYTKMLREKFSEEDFVFTYSTEVIFSVGEKRNKSFLSQGELRQVFYIDESSKECMEKMISSLFKYKITSHSVWQYLSEYHEEKLAELAVKPYIYSIQ